MPTLDELIAEQVKRHQERQAAGEETSPETTAEPQDIYAETESPATPERLVETPEAPPPSVETEPVAEAAVPPPAAASVPSQRPAPSAQPPKDPLLADIEAAMQDGLEELYAQLPPARQKVFRQRGEHAASSIRRLVSAAHANVKKIFDLLIGWLKLIPGANRFFLEQEAKIKTDKILIAAEEERRRGHLT